MECNEFQEYIRKVAFHLKRQPTAEEVIFDVMDSFDAGLYAEQCAEEILCRQQEAEPCPT